MAGTQGTADVVDALLRAGANETIADDEGDIAVDVIGDDIDLEDRLAEESSACESCWPRLAPIGHGVAEATWCCAVLT